jgi:hypothetical protein
MSLENITETEIEAVTDSKSEILVPPRPAKSFRVVLNLNYRADRMDNVLLEALKNQDENLSLKIISRGALKDLFTNSRVLIKGQRAKSNSSIAKGLTYVDILGF